MKILCSSSEIENDAALKLKEFMESEEYETESLEMDVGDDGKGNISSSYFGQQLLQLLIKFIQNNKRTLKIICKCIAPKLCLTINIC